MILQMLISFVSKETISQETKYNENYSIACHNCYEPDYATRIEDVFSFTKTIEIDIWDSKIGAGLLSAGPRLNQDWYVKHDPWRMGNLNCCGGTFRNCLDRINTWSSNNPNHDVITVFIDKEEDWSEPNESRKPQDLDEVLLSIFTREKIFTPVDLLQDKENLKAAVPINWPNLNTLKGKLIFVIANANSFFNSNLLDKYIDSRNNNSICFVAPEISNEGEIQSPAGISQENANNIVFYNLKYSSRNLSETINLQGFVSRVYGSPETIETFNDLVNIKVNFIAMYNFKLK